MPVTVRTFETLGEAANALGSEREARFFGGGTLLMRAVNEGNPPFRTIVRTTDPRLKEIRGAGQRIALGAGVTMAAILREPRARLPPSGGAHDRRPRRAQRRDRRRQPVRRDTLWRLRRRRCSR